MLISIITVSYNSGSTIYDTLHSICSQTYPNIEHIVIDGGSTDDTLKIVKGFPHVAKLISEKDNGLYDAMNKGIRMASGDIIGILNSDDVYTHPEVISTVAEKFLEKDVSATYGDLQYVKSNNLQAVVRTWKAGQYTPSDFYYGWMPPHPTFFVRKKIFAATGLFNTSLNSASDYELMLRILFKERYKAAYIPEVLVKMRTGGVSNGSLAKRLRANKEDRIAWKINDLKPYFFTLYLKPLRKVFQFLVK